MRGGTAYPRTLSAQLDVSWFVTVLSSIFPQSDQSASLLTGRATGVTPLPPAGLAYSEAVGQSSRSRIRPFARCYSVTGTHVGYGRGQAAAWTISIPSL